MCILYVCGPDEKWLFCSDAACGRIISSRRRQCNLTGAIRGELKKIWLLFYSER